MAALRYMILAMTLLACAALWYATSISRTTHGVCKLFPIPHLQRDVSISKRNYDRDFAGTGSVPISAAEGLALYDDRLFNGVSAREAV
jgi:hypothetical protein